MAYIENPKTAGSGIVCAIPQTGLCPNGCRDCFFNSGRGYLEPLEQNLPNVPDPEIVSQHGCVVRMNDGNDSNVQKRVVLDAAKWYDWVFFNTSIPDLDFPGPVVLTVNPGEMTDVDFHRIDVIPKNLMFVRVRTNYWNVQLVHNVVRWYTDRDVPVVLTFMAYWDIDAEPNLAENMYRDRYIWRQRTMNPYWAIRGWAWREIMGMFHNNFLVYSCGREGEEGTTECRYCGNCLREFGASKVRLWDG